jgi:hypothetical protein
MERFMDEVAEKGRLDSAMPWDKEGPRVLAKSFKDSKSWLFTTFGCVAFLASFEELDAVIRENEVAFGLLRQPDSKGDCFLLLPPCEVSWDTREVSKNVELTTVTITTCTGNISCHPHAVLAVSPMHPHDFTNHRRWPHLPFYNDWQLYIRWKAKHYLRRNEEFLHKGGVLVAATKESTWEAEEPPVLVASLVPAANFKVTPRCALPYQNPKLTRESAGMETIKESLKRKAVEDAREAAFLEELAQWERNAYALGKEITLRTCGTEERRKANLARFGYIMEMDPRFNGEHAALGYD